MEVEKCIVLHNGKLLNGSINRKVKSVTFYSDYPLRGTFTFMYRDEKELEGRCFFFNEKGEVSFEKYNI